MIVLGRESEEDLLRKIGEKKGSVVSYFGYVREYANGRKVRGMECRELEDSMEKMREIEEEIRSNFPVENVVLYHSLGTLGVGDLLAAVIVSTVHREDGFAACRYGIDRIKEIEPVQRVEF